MCQITLNMMPTPIEFTGDLSSSLYIAQIHEIKEAFNIDCYFLRQDNKNTTHNILLSR
jgi:hypothetical protein